MTLYICTIVLYSTVLGKESIVTLIMTLIMTLSYDTLSLHWLPIRQRIDYKILTLTYKALHGMAPEYISNLLQVRKNSKPTRSGSETVLVIPMTRTVKYGVRSFEYSAPYLWKQLPSDIKDAPSFGVFKARLKTYLFKKAYF